MFREEYFGKNKENRKKYYDSRAVLRMCRNHGVCLRCQGNRLYQVNKNLEKTDAMLKDLEDF